MLGSNNANRNLEFFTMSEFEKLNIKKKIKALTAVEDSIILVANHDNKFSIFYSPKNFGGTRLKKKKGSNND